MFTGIVQGMAKLIFIERKQNFQTYTIELLKGMSDGLMIGASISNNGCCLTVTRVEGNLVSFDLMQTTLKLTNLGNLNEGMFVNVERSMTFGGEIGGHNMSGHISTTAKVDEIVKTTNNCSIWFSMLPNLMKYILEKGYIGLDGCSLTIGEIEEQRFRVDFIPETLKSTLFGKRTVGDRINVEFDLQTQAIVDTIERILARKQL
ncbi:riboflavin synthase alpha chain [Candidatus Photodesmus blepharus]|uniref:Riboflavin synthase n=1 Tax=Candidatus Photodesmus blepharonis TaxID=1179155 RepID=A0A084CPM5_9GAMM|nr:riboflavin synthase [Candidatus Photodesmus blepharus]KEY91754.1 riboflavin synthase alpha chain [Candidatus Photodesmus blepharus]